MAFSRFFSNLRSADGVTVVSMMLNLLSSICFVSANNLVMFKYGFNYATFFHLTCTFLHSIMASKLGLFEIKKLSIVRVSKLAAFDVAFIGLANLSLNHNTAGFYQVIQVMAKPTIVAIESVLYKKYQDAQVKAGLFSVCIGAVLTSGTELHFNDAGCMYAIAGAIVGAFTLIWTGSLQESLDCNALQLQTYVAPLSALFAAPFMPIFDNWQAFDPRSFWNYKLAPESMTFLALSGCIAFLVNASVYLVIGKSSAVSYNVLWSFKRTMLMVQVLPYFVKNGRPSSWRNSCGMFLALSGVFWYLSLQLEKARIENEARGRTYNDERIAFVFRDEMEVHDQPPGQKSIVTMS